METLVVVTRPSDWPSDLPGVRVVPARAYLTAPEFSALRRAKVFNLCRSYRYQSYGYYVSLLAEARGHKVLPGVLTMRDLRTPAIIRSAADELGERIQRSLRTLSSDQFELSIYFGRNLAERHNRLAQALFRQFPAPLLRASFVRAKTGEWVLRDVNAIPTSGIPDAHREFAFSAAQAFFAARNRAPRKAAPSRYDLAILDNPDDPTRPSTDRALKRFEKAAEALGIAVERIGRQDAARLAEFDALFIRETTAVNHPTYRVSRRAEAEGLVVIDDPSSILRCTNKVFLAELLAHHGIPTPITAVLHRDNLLPVLDQTGLPVILKQPDSSSSLGVYKADTLVEARDRAHLLFETSDLLIAQEFLPTEFDWRIGVLDRKPLYAARYAMARNHWKLVDWAETGSRVRYGGYEAVAVEDVPAAGLQLAMKAANLIGDGLYGVDLKEVNGRWVVIEVNDNPSIEDGVEDKVLGDDLYRRIMTVFLERIEARKNGRRMP